jgi:pSer/pThr/pTyr-binding forkhead associated (FHA) protein
MDKNQFSRFEGRIQALVEGGFARLFAGRLHAHEVALRLARVMEEEARTDEDGVMTAPNRYTVHVHPDDYTVLLRNKPDLPTMLAKNVFDLAGESGFLLDDLPQVDLLADDAVTPHSVWIAAEHVPKAQHSTQLMATPPTPPEIPVGTAHSLPVAYLVVNGDRYVPLDRTVINIGRRPDNTVVLDDARVSRQHCQLRFRFGKFVLYDLGSRGGTFVNNARVAECVLRPGDVISLAGTQLVYVVDEDTTGPAPTGSDTQIRLNREDLGGDEAR